MKRNHALETIDTKDLREELARRNEILYVLTEDGNMYLYRHGEKVTGVTKLKITGKRFKNGSTRDTFSVKTSEDV